MTSTIETVDAVVIGAGVVGLAVARALALAGREVLILEAESTFGTKTSSRSSEVIHSGIYYARGSLKAKFCVQGRHLLYAYCADRAIAYKRCGKLIVANSVEQVGSLRAIETKARANGVDDLQFLTRKEACAMEPDLVCEAALYAPSTGIIDSHALMLSLLADVENSCGVLAVNTRLVRGQVMANGIRLVTADGTQLLAHSVVNATGLAAPAVAQLLEGLAGRHIPAAQFAKGNYFRLVGRTPFRRLIYPVPEEGGLGVHLTLDLAGQAKFGPDVQWVSSADDLQVDPTRADAFYAEVRKYWPGLADGTLKPDYAGIRPKISGPGQGASDFLVQGPLVHGVPGLVNLFGIESPGLTSCLAMGDYVARILQN